MSETMTFTQSEFDVRLEWGEQGVKLLAPISDVVVIVDVLSFSTSVEIAASREAIVYPFRGEMKRAREFTHSVGAVLAEKSRDAKYSLSPRSMLSVSKGTRIVLPSPNGSTLSLATGKTPTLAGCLRNARAVAETANEYGNRIAIIPAGERWPDGSLRPSFEDLIGAGAIINYLNGKCSPEALVTKSAFAAVKENLATQLLQCGSGKELIERGFKEDVLLASELNTSDCVPLLHNGAYRAI